MKRLLLSVAGGVLIITALLLLIGALDSYALPKYPDTMLVERVPLAWVLEWPMPVLRSLFPPASGSQLRLSPVGVVLFPLINLTVYSALTYAVLRSREKRERTSR